MSWEKLVQRLWNVAEFQGFSAFEDKIRAMLPDVRLDALLEGLCCLFRAGKTDVAAALLCEFLCGHSSHQYIKQQLYCFVLFCSTEIVGSDAYGDELLDQLRDLIGLGLIDEAGLRLVREIEEGKGDDSDLVVLLGRVSMLKYANNKKEMVVESGEIGCAVNAGFDFPEVTLEESVGPEYNMFTWDEQPEVVLKHDDECVRSAVLLQMSMSANSPIETDSYEWDIHLEDAKSEEVEKPALSSGAIDECMPSSSLSGCESALDMPGARLAYFESRFVKLKMQEKKMLEFVFFNPKSSLAKLAEEFVLTEPVINYMTGVKLKFWLDRDKFGAFSIKQGLVDFLPKNAFGKAGENLSDEKADGNVPSPNSPVGVASGLDLLSSDAKKILAYFAENIGQKTHVAANALGMNHLVMLSLLNGCLDDYLERDRAFAVTPRSGVPELLVAAGLSEVIWVGI